MVGNNFDISKGIFTVPQNGIYLFVVDGVTSGFNVDTALCGGYGDVKVQINGNDHKWIPYFYEDYWQEISGITSIELQRGDKISLHSAHSGCIRADGTAYFSFMGILLLGV